MNFASAVSVGLLIVVAVAMAACLFWIVAGFILPTRRNTRPFDDPGKIARERDSPRSKGMS